jgi:hypothetical protein
MATNDTSQPLDPPEAIPGEPLMPPSEAEALADAPTVAGSASTPLGSAGGTAGVPVEPTAPTADVPPVHTTTSIADVPPSALERGAEPDDGVSKLKTGALLAGAAALATKVRHEAPKKVQQIREKRAEGRCVIVTEVDGRMLAIGPYKDEASAEPQAFRVGGNPHVVELVTDSAFFGPLEGGSRS